MRTAKKTLRPIFFVAILSGSGLEGWRVRIRVCLPQREASQAAKVGRDQHSKHGKDLSYKVFFVCYPYWRLSITTCLPQGEASQAAKTSIGQNSKTRNSVPPKLFLLCVAILTGNGLEGRRLTIAVCLPQGEASQLQRPAAVRIANKECLGPLHMHAVSAQGLLHAIACDVRFVVASNNSSLLTMHAQSTPRT